MSVRISRRAGCESAFAKDAAFWLAAGNTDFLLSATFLISSIYDLKSSAHLPHFPEISRVFLIVYLRFMFFIVFHAG